MDHCIKAGIDCARLAPNEDGQAFFVDLLTAPCPIGLRGTYWQRNFAVGSADRGAAAPPPWCRQSTSVRCWASAPYSVLGGAAAPSGLPGRARPGGARPGEVPSPGCHHGAGGPALAARSSHPTAVGTGALCGAPRCPGAQCPAWGALLSSPMPALPTACCKQSGQKGARAGAPHPPEEQQGPLPLRAAPRRLRVALVRTPLWMELFSCLSLPVAEPSRAAARPCFLEKQPSCWASSYMTLLPRSSPRTAGIIPSSSFPSFSFRESFPRRDLHPR